MFKIINLIACCLLLFILIGCRNSNNSNAPYLFKTLSSETTHIEFENVLHPTPDFNMFKYMYFYNGAGVGTGDFNNDGLIDIFFAANQSNNKIFINKGQLKFEDVTTQAGIPQDGGWSTGVSVVDINNDGLLDIYVCRVGNFEKLQSQNQFLICTGITKNGIPQYVDKAKEMGLAMKAFGTQSVFFDYDLDGDLDMFLMNHSLRYNGTFNPRSFYENTFDSLSADYLFQNDHGQFKDVSKQAGILGTVIGYGLGICVSDINMDGYPDIYVGNDFHENDYLYINQKNGTFKESLTSSMAHTSQFSMGVDVADANNDGHPEIVSMDMTPNDPYILKRSLDEDGYDLFQYKRKYGYIAQFAKNALQYNRGNGLFSEIAMYSNVFATDWSWAPLWVDFDNDGQKDLFISNGIPKRLNDIDYVNYVSSTEVQEKIRAGKIEEKDMALIEKFPEIKLSNVFYLNKGELKFNDEGSRVQNNIPTFSNGAAYADFDLDGDLDIVVNNINDKALIYENQTNTINNSHWLRLIFKGDKENINAIGAKVIVYTKAGKQFYEKQAVRGFQSSMEGPLSFGLGNSKADSVLLIWPDNTCQHLYSIGDTTLKIEYKKGLPLFQYQSLFEDKQPQYFKDITSDVGINYKHTENLFNEFNREQLMPHMVSREGPALAVGDIDGDNQEDVFIGSSRGYKSAIFRQEKNGHFTKLPIPALDADSVYEDVDAVFADVNGDHKNDLIIASGGNEFFGSSEYLMPRVYINDGKGQFYKKTDAFLPNIRLTASCILATDMNNDGLVDLFIGARAVPFEYGAVPKSYILINNGSGGFTDMTAQIIPALEKIGFVTDAAFSDIDGDHVNDLIITKEWGGIDAFLHKEKQWLYHSVANESGWWTFVKPVDMDNDGDIDLVVGNFGENNRFNATTETPLRMFYNDFDDNGKKEQILTYYLKGKQIPFANKDELQRQLPSLKKKYLYAEDFAKATVNEIFTKQKLTQATTFEATNFSNCVFVNNGKGDFVPTKLPWQAQLSTLRDAWITDLNGDGLQDIVAVGNFFPNTIQMSMNDADYGSILLNTGKSGFNYQNLNIPIKGESRHIMPVIINGKKCCIIVRNNDFVVSLQLQN